MTDNVETMFSASNEVPWHGLGEVIKDAVSSLQALQLSGLNYTVINKDVYVDGRIVPWKVANVRDTDGQILGIVSKRYRIIQNSEAFAFTDELLGHGIKYETAGSLKNGRKIWMLANLDPISVAGDNIAPYLVFTNSHDGYSGVRVALTTVRVVCQNTLNLALTQAPRMWYTQHTGNIAMKLEEARRTLQLTHNYLEEFPVVVEKMIDTNIYQDEFINFVDTIFPLPEDASNIVESRVTFFRDTFTNIYTNTDNIQRFKETTWGVYNALSDMITHMKPIRDTTTFKENHFMKLSDGHPILQKAEELLVKIQR
jgi:phage/plasmid-like protein (TIGR03299 family)